MLAESAGECGRKAVLAQSAGEWLCLQKKRQENIQKVERNDCACRKCRAMAVLAESAVDVG